MKAKKFFTIVLTLAMIFGIASVGAFAAENWESNSITISTADDLKKLATKVNEGEAFSGVTFTLENSIDLNEEEWIPIGNKDDDKFFEGIFDGKNFEISGLSITASNEREDYVALFGAIKNATIKNLTVSGEVYGGNIAGIVARMNGGTVENCVSNVKLTCVDNKKAGGIVCLAGATGDPSFITKCINNGSVTINGINSNATAGGILAYIGNGGGRVTVSECINKSDVSGGAYAAGICGYCSGGNSVFEIKDCENYGTISAATTGSIVGFVGIVGDLGDHKIYENKNYSSKNKNFVGLNNDSKEYSSNVNLPLVTPVAKIGDAEYTDLQEAIDAADGQTVTLVSDVNEIVMPTADSTNNADNCLVAIGAEKKVILDLNGYTISVKGADEALYDTIAIRNHGDLTITDTSNDKNGKITFSFDGTQEKDSSQIHSAILNFGTLIVECGNIENIATTGRATHAVYNYSWGGNVNFVLNGGTLISAKGYSVYTSAYDDFSQYVCNVTINDGVLKNGLYYNNTGAHAENGVTLNITGGTFQVNEVYNDVLWIDEINGGDMKILVTGGIFNGAVGYNADNDAKIKFITGGTFTNDVSAYVADGYTITENSNGTYSVESAGTLATENVLIQNMAQGSTEDGATTYRVGCFAAIDSANYSMLGIEVKADGGKVTGSGTTQYLYTYINVTNSEGVATKILPETLGETNKYIFGRIMAFTTNYTDFSFRPFAVSLDGKKTFYGNWSKEYTVDPE